MHLPAPGCTPTGSRARRPTVIACTLLAPPSQASRRRCRQPWLAQTVINRLARRDREGAGPIACWVTHEGCARGCSRGPVTRVTRVQGRVFSQQTHDTVWQVEEAEQAEEAAAGVGSRHHQPFSTVAVAYCCSQCCNRSGNVCGGHCGE